MKPTQPLLIDVPECLSPKLKWLAKFGLTTRKTSRGRYKCEGNEHMITGKGRTEADAIWDSAMKNGIKHFLLP